MRIQAWHDVQACRNCRLCATTHHSTNLNHNVKPGWQPIQMFKQTKQQWHCNLQAQPALLGAMNGVYSSGMLCLGRSYLLNQAATQPTVLHCCGNKPTALLSTLKED
jgi:hypothetical protein